MKVSPSFFALIVTSIIAGSNSSFAAQITDAQRANLADSIKSAVNGSAVQPSTEAPSTIPPNAIIESPSPTSAPATPEQSAVPTVIILQPNFVGSITGATGPGTGTLGGVISEALNLAQVAIVVFGQSILGAFGAVTGTIISATNSTRIIGNVGIIG